MQFPKQLVDSPLSVVVLCGLLNNEKCDDAVVSNAAAIDRNPPTIRLDQALEDAFGIRGNQLHLMLGPVEKSGNQPGGHISRVLRIFPIVAKDDLEDALARLQAVRSSNEGTA